MTAWVLRLDCDDREPETLCCCGGLAACFSARHPGGEGPNEDALAWCDSADGADGVLALADGAGGGAAGAAAAAAALGVLGETLSDLGPDAVLAGFDRANAAVLGLGVGAATTAAVVTLEDGWLRSYHVGDSLTLVVGQRGRRRLQTTAHSPVGYAVEAGLLDEDEALHHEERHFVLNLLGTPDARVEVSAPLRLRPRDTVLLASDGLSDNLHLEEIIGLIRKGPLDRAATALVALARERMRGADPGLPSKPDDLTFLLYRPGR